MVCVQVLTRFEGGGTSHASILFIAFRRILFSPRRTSIAVLFLRGKSVRSNNPSSSSMDVSYFANLVPRTSSTAVLSCAVFSISGMTVASSCSAIIPKQNRYISSGTLPEYGISKALWKSDRWFGRNTLQKLPPHPGYRFVFGLDLSTTRRSCPQSSRMGFRRYHRGNQESHSHIVVTNPSWASFHTYCKSALPLERFEWTSFPIPHRPQTNVPTTSTYVFVWDNVVQSRICIEHVRKRNHCNIVFLFLDFITFLIVFTVCISPE